MANDQSEKLRQHHAIVARCVRDLKRNRPPGYKRAIAALEQARHDIARRRRAIRRDPFAAAPRVAHARRLARVPHTFAKEIGAIASLCSVQLERQVEVAEQIAAIFLTTAVIRFRDDAREIKRLAGRSNLARANAERMSNAVNRKWAASLTRKRRRKPTPNGVAEAIHARWNNRQALEAVAQLEDMRVKQGWYFLEGRLRFESLIDSPILTEHVLLPLFNVAATAYPFVNRAALGRHAASLARAFFDPVVTERASRDGTVKLSGRAVRARIERRRRP